MTVPRRHVVALIHGIRTEAAWAELVKSVLEGEANLVVEPLRYGYFDLFRFICPIGTRRGVVREIHEKLRALDLYYRDSDLSVIAHSFGTYIVASILKRGSFFRVNRVVFCGSVVHRRFRWTDVAHKIAETKVLNDCGTLDVWPVLARSVTYGYGATGTFGFGDPKVRDRFHRVTHGEYFNATFVERYWVPYIARGTIDGTAWEKVRTAPPLVAVGPGVGAGSLDFLDSAARGRILVPPSLSAQLGLGQLLQDLHDSPLQRCTFHSSRSSVTESPVTDKRQSKEQRNIVLAGHCQVGRRWRVTDPR